LTKYYHISPNLLHRGHFTPDIPQTRRALEDNLTPRVCVSKSIEGALTSIPNGGSLLYELLSTTNGFLKLYVIDTEELEIADEDIIDSEILFEHGLVEDANHTDEVWILTPFSISKSHQHIILPLDWDEESIDIIPHHVLELSEKEYNHDIESAYYDVYKENIPAGIKITDLKVHNLMLEKDETLSMPYMESYFLEDWVDLIKDNEFPVSVFDEGYNLAFTAKENIDLTPSVIEFFARNTV